MPRFKTSKEVYESCERDACYKMQEHVDIVKIKHKVGLAFADLEFVRPQMLRLRKDTLQWSTVYKLHYDAFHQLCEAFIRFDRVKSEKHQCLFAYIIEQHPELDLDWAFLERIRTARNGIQYYGTPSSYKERNDIELQINLYINTVKKAVDDKLKNTA